MRNRRVNLNVFANLAAPVFEKELDSLRLEGSTGEADVQVRRWCALAMHELWSVSWVVAHDCSMHDVHKARVKRCCQFLSGRWQSLSETDEAAHTRRIEHDRHFLKIAMHIVSDNQDAALKMLFPASFVCPDELNYCFGTTILGVAVRWGAEALIKEVLKRTPTTSEQHLDVYLRLAARRKGLEPYVIVAMLLDHFQVIANSRIVFAQRLLFKAVRKATIKADHGGPDDIEVVQIDNRVVFHAVLRWIASSPATPGVLEMMEECFRRLNERYLFSNKTLENLRFLDKELHDLGTEPISAANPMPAFMTGAYYKHVSLREVVRASRAYEMFRFNCPCWAEGKRRKCCCRETHYCTCETVLPGYCLPDYRYRRPGKPLFEAASRGRLNWVDRLLWAGADPRNYSNSESLLFWARRGGIQREVIQLLVQYGWSLRQLTIFQPESAGKQDMAAQPNHFRSSADVEWIGGSSEVWPEQWAAGSERWDSPWITMFDPCHSNFWGS